MVDQHGNLARVTCLGCGSLSSREELAGRLDRANPRFAGIATAINPDGDVELADEALDGFTVVACRGCGGLLKPDVVYFGETVPAERVSRSFEILPVVRGDKVVGAASSWSREVGRCWCWARR